MSSVNYLPSRIRARRTSSTVRPVALGLLIDDAAGEYLVAHLERSQAEQLLAQLQRALELGPAVSA